MVVAFKTREIGILLAMGLRRDGIRRIFMTQGAIVGLVGTGIGMVLGLTIGWVVDGSGLISIDPSIYFIDKLPVRIEPLDVIAVVGASVIAALVATIPPSRAAAALAPVEAIRAE
jgi:lipoprotein-releasing system permease protein